MVYSIWRSFTAIHKLQPGRSSSEGTADELLWLTVNSFKLRARTALTQAKLRDQKRQTTDADTNTRPNHSYEQMCKIWHRPPHIVMTEEEVTFGRMWPSPGEGPYLAMPGEYTPPASRAAPKPPDIARVAPTEDSLNEWEPLSPLLEPTDPLPL